MQKRWSILAILILLCLLLAACQPAETQQEPPISPSRNDEETPQADAYAYFGAEAPEDALGLIVNFPTEEDLAQIEISESAPLLTDGETMLIVPRYAGSQVELWSLRDDDAANMVFDEMLYEKANTPEGFVLETELIRAEGMPVFGLRISYSPSAGGMQLAEYLFAYDGKDGNPYVEYATVTMVGCP